LNPVAFYCSLATGGRKAIGLPEVIELILRTRLRARSGMLIQSGRIRVSPWWLVGFHLVLEFGGLG
jgi:hypothetical protein